jgi:hypothetical protein
MRVDKVKAQKKKPPAKKPVRKENTRQQKKPSNNTTANNRNHSASNPKERNGRVAVGNDKKPTVNSNQQQENKVRKVPIQPNQANSQGNKVRKDPIQPKPGTNNTEADKKRNAEILLRALKTKYGGALSLTQITGAAGKIMDHVYNKLGNFLKFARPGGTDSPWENRGWFKNLSGYSSNVHDIYTATTPNQPGWMQPGYMSDYIQKLGQNLKKYKSFDQAAAAIRGQINPMGQTPTFVLPNNYQNNPFRLHSDNKNLRYYLVTAIGHDTGRQAFINDMNLMGKAFEQKFGSKRINIGDNSIGKLKQAFDRIAKEAQANPDKPYKAIYVFSGHGNVGMIQGNGNSGFYKRQLQSLMASYQNVKNLAFTPIIESCHSGSFLGRRNA